MCLVVLCISLGEDVLCMLLNEWDLGFCTWVAFGWCDCGVWWGFEFWEEDGGPVNMVINGVGVCECLGV